MRGNVTIFKSRGLTFLALSILQSWSIIFFLYTSYPSYIWTT